MFSTSKNLITSLRDKFSLFVSYKDLKIFTSLLLLMVEKLKGNNIIYCDSSEPIKWLINRVKKEYCIKVSAKTRFLAIKEVYIDREYTKFPDFVPNPSDVVIDVGAETGDYTILCSKYYGAEKVYAFEPNKTSYEVLINNITINECRNVKTFLLGLSSYDGVGHPYFNGDSVTWENGKRDISISVKKLDSLGLTKVNLLKVDVEGNEVEVLKGGKNIINKFKPKIIIETHSKTLEEQVIQLLDDMNYRIKHKGRVVIDEKGNKVVNLFFECFDFI